MIEKKSRTHPEEMKNKVTIEQTNEDKISNANNFIENNERLEPQKNYLCDTPVLLNDSDSSENETESNELKNPAKEETETTKSNKPTPEKMSSDNSVDTDISIDSSDNSIGTDISMDSIDDDPNNPWITVQRKQKQKTPTK